MKNKYSLKICGNSINVISEDDEEYVTLLARELDDRLTDLVTVQGKCSKMNALTLCCLDYLDQTFRLTKEVEKLKKELSKHRNDHENR